MDLWLRSRRAHLALPAGLAAYALVIWLVRDRLADMPSLAGGGHVPLMLLAPLPVCAGVLVVLDASARDTEAAGIRPFARLEAGMVVVSSAVAVGIGYGASWALDSGAAGAVGRNTLLLTGLMLASRRVLGERALIVPLACVVFVVVVGYNGYGQPHRWALLPARGTDVPALLVALLAFLGGLALTCGARRAR